MIKPTTTISDLLVRRNKDRIYVLIEFYTPDGNMSKAFFSHTHIDSKIFDLIDRHLMAPSFDGTIYYVNAAEFNVGPETDHSITLRFGLRPYINPHTTEPEPQWIGLTESRVYDPFKHKPGMTDKEFFCRVYVAPQPEPEPKKIQIVDVNIRESEIPVSSQELRLERIEKAIEQISNKINLISTT